MKLACSVKVKKLKKYEAEFIALKGKFEKGVLCFVWVVGTGSINNSENIFWLYEMKQIMTGIYVQFSTIFYDAFIK